MATDVPASPDLGRPQSQARLWFEPALVICMMIGSLIINRRRSRSLLLRRDDADDSTASLLQKTESDSDYDDDDSIFGSSPKSGRSCSKALSSLDTSRFAGYPHNRILQKFPFLVEMFYWGLNYVTYVMTKKVAELLYSQHGHAVTALAQQHGIDILYLEHHSVFGFLFAEEVAVQQFFLRHKEWLSLFNQIYSLVHIPGTVAFLSWYYWAAPNHDTFAVARRTMTLGNFAAFFVFTLYPCMPPRLLPESFGFKDTVRQEHAESVWAGASNVNQLAAMPSLHFTYAFVIGSTFLHHSGLLPLLFRSRHKPAPEPRRSALHVVGFALAAVAYPILVLLVIVATANHYWLDAVVATAIVTLSFYLNKIWYILLPAERLFTWCLRIHKPVPTTGQATLLEELQRTGGGWRKERMSVDIRDEVTFVGGR